MCDCRLTWLVRHRRHLMERVLHGQCDDGTAFEALDAAAFDDCPPPTAAAPTSAAAATAATDAPVDGGAAARSLAALLLLGRCFPFTQ